MIVVDLHAHPLLAATYLGRDLGRRGRPPRAWNPLRGHWDLPRALQGGLGGQVLTLYVPPWPVRRRSAVDETRRQIRFLEAFATRHADRVVRARTAAEVRDAASGGRLALMLSVEGAHALGGRLDVLEWLAGRGLVYLTLTHFVPNGVCDATEAPWRGPEPLTRWGRELVGALERLGVLVDLAHATDEAFRAVADAATRPLLVSHTGVRALCPIRRNLSDDGIRTVARSGGVVGIIAFPPYLERRALRADLGRMIDHIAYVADLVGVDHVGIGTDFDAGTWSVRGLPDVAAFPRLAEALSERGFGAVEVERILGGNFLRLLPEG